MAERLNLARGRIKRGDTLEAWTFTIGGIPSPEDAVATFSLHLEDLDTDPLVQLTSEPSGGITMAVTPEGRLTGTVDRVNAPAVGQLPWEFQVRVPTVDVAGPAGGKWTQTIFEGVIVAIQDGAERKLP